MLAIVETGGKQYQFQEGRYIDIELLHQEVDSSVEFDKIVMILAGADSVIGQPYVEGALIKGTIQNHGKAKKVLVYKQLRKKGFRNKNGHRQPFSRVMIDSISFPGKENITAEEPKAEKKEVKKAAAKATAKKTTAKKATVKTTETATEE